MGSKKDLIQTARLIAKESEEVVKMAKKVADACTDKRMKRVRSFHLELTIPRRSCQNMIISSSLSSKVLTSDLRGRHSKTYFQNSLSRKHV